MKQSKAAFKLLTATVIVFTAFRTLFLVLFSGKAAAFSTTEALHAFFLGLRFDLRMAIFMVLPLFILGNIQKLRISQKKWLAFYTFLYALALFVYGADVAYYSYLEGRINFRIFEFLKNPLISLQMVLESYNMVVWTPLYIAVVALVYWALKKYIFNAETKPEYASLSKKRKWLYITLTVLFIVLGTHSSFGQYPLRWSDAFFTQNMFLANLAMNPIHYIFDTAQNSKKDYDIKSVQKYYDAVAPYLGVTDLNVEKLNFLRPVEQTPQFTSRPNIVYIVMESMAAYKTGVFGNPAQSSPSLDKIARAGWLFENYYVPTEGTARSLFCILSGIPDINAKSTSSRNPLIIDQNTLINGLKDYRKYYFIGGSAAWGNIRGVYMNNVEGLEMYEDSRLEGPRTDVWGLSDLDLFRQSAKVLKERSTEKNGEPFFALIQTAGFHRPYTIPDEHGDFTLQTLTKEQLNQYGFNSNEEYNSFRFADYSMGEFFKLIENSKFYKNTIFIVQGDHGLPHDGAAHLSEGYKFFNLNRFHTPLVFFSPLIQEPKVIKNIITEPDVWPTVLGLLGMQHPNTALGRNVFSEKLKNQPRYAFSYVYYSHPLQLLLYDDKFLAFGTENGIESLHEYMGTDPKTDVKNKYPDKFNEMSHLLTGIFETSKYLLHHNKKIKNSISQ